MMRYTLVALMTLGMVIRGSDLGAQQRESLELSVADPAAAVPQVVQSPRGVGFQLMGGVTTYVNRPHAAAGALLRVPVAGWSVLGLANLGRGGEYDSQLYGGAVARGLLESGAVEVSGLVGLAYYREKGPTDISHAAKGALFGAVADMPLGPFVASVVLSDFVGRYAREDVNEPFTFFVPRLLMAIGF